MLKFFLSILGYNENPNCVIKEISKITADDIVSVLRIVRNWR